MQEKKKKLDMLGQKTILFIHSHCRTWNQITIANSLIIHGCWNGIKFGSCGCPKYCGCCICPKYFGRCINCTFPSFCCSSSFCSSCCCQKGARSCWWMSSYCASVICSDNPLNCSNVILRCVYSSSKSDYLILAPLFDASIASPKDCARAINCMTRL